MYVDSTKQTPKRPTAQPGFATYVAAGVIVGIGYYLIFDNNWVQAVSFAVMFAFVTRLVDRAKYKHLKHKETK